MSDKSQQTSIGNTDTLIMSDLATQKLLFHFSIATSLIFFTFGVIYLLKGEVLLGTIETFFGLLQIVNLYLMRQHQNYILSSKILLYSVYFMTYVIFITGGLGGTGHLWILFIPLFTMLLLEQKDATRSLIAYVAGLVFITAAGTIDIYELKYDFVLLRQTTVVFLLFLYLTYHNEKVKKMVREKLQEKNEQLEHLSRTDHLTNIANRMSLNEKLEYEYSRTQRNSEPLSLIMIDIDYFKKINDQYGHITGDVILKGVSKLLHESVREIDLIGRWGGEEFMIILPQTKINDTKVIAEKLRMKLNENDFGLNEPVTASFGVTQYKTGESLDMFVQRADNLLYTAKEEGRNRVIDHI
ncbi:MAG: GGDEF domain-containing protein [Campylobacterota bacterium]|nr:GGDEF domain-containing protein [Campylobacterota bacterium]